MTDNKPQDSNPKPHIYEVFRREKAGAPMVHAGSVTAAGPDLALIYARESFGRRGESHALWVVPRTAVIALDDADLLAPVLDRGYRGVEGYRMRDKLKVVRERLERTER
jgi:ring-1,2-phenylacetyl-CoA epoxidase subunit PaaB